MVARILGRHSVDDLWNALQDRDRLKLEKVIKDLKICTTHRDSLRRKYRIIRLTPTNAHKTTFLLNDTGTEESVMNYFWIKYRKKLKFPHLPCLVVGTSNRPVYLPIEMCDVISGQRHLRKLNERQVRILI